MIFLRVSRHSTCYKNFSVSSFLFVTLQDLITGYLDHLHLHINEINELIKSK